MTLLEKFLYLFVKKEYVPKINYKPFKTSRHHLIIFSLLVISSILLISITSSTRKQYNVILISIDSLRLDHLGTYNYTKNTSPNIDKMAAKSIVFENVISQAPWTIPSHTSILTSLYPYKHGNIYMNSVLSNNITSISEVLRQKGYSTAAFVGGFLGKVHGLDQGFQLYDDENSNSAEILSRFSNWLFDNYNNPFFVFIHVMDVHCLRDPPDEFLEVFWPNFSEVKETLNERGLTQEYFAALDQTEQYESPWEFHVCPELIDTSNFNFSEDRMIDMLNVYDASVLYTDYNIGKILNILEDLDLDEWTIIIITADHGEEFGEHGYINWHDGGLDELMLRVPLIMFVPDIGAKRVNEPVQTIDIAPTILDILGIRGMDESQGESLLPIISGLFSFEGRRVRLSELYSDIFTIRLDDVWKLVQWNDEIRLYNLDNDSSERTNLAENYTTLVNFMMGVYNNMTSDRAKTLSVDLNQEYIQKLIELGYLID